MKTVLYTPATGFPDLEVKIAYGLVRIGIEAGFAPTMCANKGFYEICYNAFDADKAKRTIMTIFGRLLTEQKFFNLGVRAKDRSRYPVKEDELRRLSYNTPALDKLFTLRRISDFNFKKNYFCKHDQLEKFGGSSGLILLSSFHAGKPYFRDNRSETFNLNLCELCGYVAVLGLYSFGFIIHMGTGENRKSAVVLPIPETNLSDVHLQELFSLQKTLHNLWLSDVIPADSFTLGLLAKVPSLSDIVNELKLIFHISFITMDQRGTTVERTSLENTFPFSNFIGASPYNSATVDRLLGDSRNKPKISSLAELTNVLHNRQRDNISKFARLYVQETSSDKFTNLLYYETAKYLLKEVAMIKSEIIENPALSSMACTLRYFIREKKYGYADAIRNARKDSRDFEETIFKVLREGTLRREQQKPIYLPREEEIQELFRLANQDFESTKLALVILAFSFSAKKEEEAEKEEQDA